MRPVALVYAQQMMLRSIILQFDRSVWLPVTQALTCCAWCLLAAAWYCSINTVPEDGDSQIVKQHTTTTLAPFRLNMAHYRALQRPPAHSWLLLLAGVLIGITLSSLLHQNRWQSEHQPGVADLRKARTPQIKDDGENMDGGGRCSGRCLQAASCKQLVSVRPPKILNITSHIAALRCAFSNTSTCVAWPFYQAFSPVV